MLKKNKLMQKNCFASEITQINGMITELFTKYMNTLYLQIELYE